MCVCKHAGQVFQTRLLPNPVKHTLHRAVAQSIRRLPLHLYPDVAAAPRTHRQPFLQSFAGLHVQRYRTRPATLALPHQHPPLTLRQLNVTQLQSQGFVKPKPGVQSEDHQRGVPQAGQPALGITHPGGL